MKQELGKVPPPSRRPSSKEHSRDQDAENATSSSKNGTFDVCQNSTQEANAVTTTTTKGRTYRRKDIAAEALEKAKHEKLVKVRQNSIVCLRLRKVGLNVCLVSSRHRPSAQLLIVPN